MEQLRSTGHQLQQVKRRFNAVETSTIDITILSFKLKPTDPDFPYELEALDCVLQIPKSYPKDGPTLNIQNKEIEKGFRINIENGFKSIVESTPNGSLLSWLNTLDRRLEGLLSGKKADTIKFVANRPVYIPTPIIPVEIRRSPQAAYYTAQPIYSPVQRQAAAERRVLETRQLEARLSRLSMYAKSSDGIAYTLPIEPRKKHDLPAALKNVRSVRLFVPMLYPLLPCRIALQGVDRDAAKLIEHAFEERVKNTPDISLIGHVNHLVTHMHIMAVEHQQAMDFQPDEIGIDELALPVEDEVDQPPQPGESTDDRSHIHFIPRPPEWNVAGSEPGDAVSDISEDASDDSESEEEANVESATAPERGVSIDFPHLQLHGIELLQLTSLSLTLRCLRCKEMLDVENLQHTDAKTQSPRVLACKKCASELTIGMEVLD